MLLFTALNLAGAKFMSESNSIVVIWKTFVPVLAIVVVAGASFHGGNFHAGGGFAPYGVHGIFAALPAGVVFALQGFEQAVQLAGEARNPKKDLSRSIITAMAIGAVLYTLLQVAFIAGVEPAHVAKDWTNPLGGSGAGDYGAWYTLALAVGAGWLGTILLIDAIVSPSGTGIVYAGTTARLSYALGEEKEMPSALASTNSRGVPAVSLVVGCIVGIACFGPFRGWSTLVGVVTAFTAIMYGFAPVALAALHKADPDRPRTYHAPAPAILLPASFVSANLVIYWGGYNYTWKLAVAMGVGLVLFAVGSSVAKTDMFGYIKNAVWVGAWLIGDVIIGLAGRYGDGSKNWLPEWIDLLVVVVFSLGIFYWAANSALRLDQVQQEIAKSAHQMEAEAKLVTS
jgi:amino acid transporter